MVREIRITVMSAVNDDVRCRKRKVGIRVIVENSACELEKGKKE